MSQLCSPSQQLSKSLLICFQQLVLSEKIIKIKSVLNVWLSLYIDHNTTEVFSKYTPSFFMGHPLNLLILLHEKIVIWKSVIPLYKLSEEKDRFIHITRYSVYEIN